MTERQFDTHPAATFRHRFDEFRRADAELRRIHVAVRAAALERGVPVEPAALTAVLGALLEEERRRGVPVGLWTEARVLEFIWTTCLLWCADRNLRAPHAVAAALEAFWGQLAVTGGFAPGSDDRDTLRLALRSCAPPPPRPKSPGGRAPRSPRRPA